MQERHMDMAGKKTTCIVSNKKEFASMKQESQQARYKIIVRGIRNTLTFKDS